METVSAVAATRIGTPKKSLGKVFAQARKADVLFDMQCGNPKIMYS
jgi:hypothetical protein